MYIWYIYSLQLPSRPLAAWMAQVPKALPAVVDTICALSEIAEPIWPNVPPDEVKLVAAYTSSIQDIHGDSTGKNQML